jgi:hypothetical protein
MGKGSINARFQLMPPHHGIRGFPDGITRVSQLTGRENKDMAKVFVGAIAGGLDAQAVRASRALLDFLFLSHYARLCDDQLEHLQGSLELFDELKDAFRATGADFDGIAKLHMIQHYLQSIRNLSVPDGTNTECSERLHRGCAKEGYRASNHIDPTEQMTTYLQRQESITSWSAYLEWRSHNAATGMEIGLPHLTTDGDNSDDDTSSIATEDDHDIRPQLLGTESKGSRKDANYLSTEIMRYPMPSLTIPIRPSFSNKLGSWIEANHNATNFIYSTNRFLQKLVPDRFSLCVTDGDLFDIYKRVTLRHTMSPGGATLGVKTELIRATPATYGKRGKISRKASYDTALMMNDASAEGLHRMSLQVGLLPSCSLTFPIAQAIE